MDQSSTINWAVPLVSIIIPTYNRAGIIRETLDSVRAQTSRNWECIVVDDGSIDDTQMIVSEYTSSDSRFSFYKRDRAPKGAPTCRNIGLHHAKGDRVIFLDSDDLLTSNCISLIVKNNQNNESVQALVFRTNKFTTSPCESVPCFEPDLVAEELSAFVIGRIIWQTSGVSWDRKFINSIGGFNEGLSRGQDWDLAVRALIHKPKLIKISDVISLYRVSLRDDRIANLPLDPSAHEELFEACASNIDLAKQYSQSPHIITHIVAGAFYRIAYLAWIGEISKSNKLLENLISKKRITYCKFAFLKFKIVFIYMLSKIFHKSKKIAENISSVDGIHRRFV